MHIDALWFLVLVVGAFALFGGVLAYVNLIAGEKAITAEDEATHKALM